MHGDYRRSRAEARAQFSRIQFRIADSVQFKIQQEINLRDDEIVRLNSYLAYLLANAEMRDDTNRAFQKPAAEQYSILQRKIREARAAADLRRTELEIHHQQLLHEFESKHRARIANLRGNHDQVRFTPVRQKPQTDYVDAFLHSLKLSTPSKPSERYLKLEHSIDQMATQADITEEKAGELQNDIIRIRGLLAQPDPPIDIPIERSYANEAGTLERLHQSQMKQLKGQTIAESERRQATEQAISKAARQFSKLKHKIEVLKQKRPKHKSPSKGLSDLLGSMSVPQKEAKLSALRQENTSLKREIARLDFMIYGKAGKYRMWKNLPM